VAQVAGRDHHGVPRSPRRVGHAIHRLLDLRLDPVEEIPGAAEIEFRVTDENDVNLVDGVKVLSANLKISFPAAAFMRSSP